MNIKYIGIALVIIGIILMIYTGFNFVTEKNVIDIGNLQVGIKENHTTRWSPIVGLVVIIVGAFMFFLAKKRQ